MNDTCSTGCNFVWIVGSVDLYSCCVLVHWYRARHVCSLLSSVREVRSLYFHTTPFLLPFALFLPPPPTLNFPFLLPWSWPFFLFPFSNNPHFLFLSLFPKAFSKSFSLFCFWKFDSVDRTLTRLMDWRRFAMF